MKAISAKSPKKLVYVDESGIDNTEDYPYGYCRKGERFRALKSGKKTQRVSIIAALNEGKIIARERSKKHTRQVKEIKV